MAFGIDDAITAGAASISLTDTLVKTVDAYRRKGQSIDIERLFDEVRITTLRQIDEADLALVQLERTLIEKGVNLNQTLQETIASTSFFEAFEARRLKQIRASFNALADAAYSAIDDIAALLRCNDDTGEMGASVVESAAFKRALQSQLLNSKSVRESINVLRTELERQKKLLK